MDSLQVDPERGMKVTLILADAAQVAEGKLYVMGGGWNVTGPDPVPFAIGGIIEVPWSETNKKHTFRFELIDLDGNAVMAETPEGAQPVAINGGFELGRPPGVRAGSFLPWPFAISGGPMPLPPASHFEWRFSIDGNAHEDWKLAFSTQPLAQSQAA